MLQFKFDAATGTYDVYEGTTRVGVFLSTVPKADTDFQLFTVQDMDNEYDAGVAEGKREVAG